MVPCDDCGLSGEGRRARTDGITRSLCDACATLAEAGSEIRVIPLDEEDLELVLAWRSHPDVYRYARKQDGPLEWEEHVSWFESRDSNRHDFVVHYDGRRVGVVSIGADDEVSIYLGDPSARGRGVATMALEWLCNRFADRAPLFAEIHSENGASKELFEACGFERAERDGEWLHYVFELT